ncbi:uncharacterized protein GGS22DRAFT_197398 [Annulohypoxylon maeteangense]|uniref:uncharacterized protein n=1 Tax=Annulohypoxylon maeteangense TaxID=1927788 RepID=UPI002007400A|nr:uncharacterized protein GGS22DRAFT_197398 [Annulohypoxylon maeteangense]KAI0880631.1 hypothetical protein GGS22DRAFT_197398 [Annulohypoxylon maeteangense]
MDKFHLSLEARHPPDSEDAKEHTATARQSVDDAEHPHAWASSMNPTNVLQAPRKLVLCFDGTGNKFRGDDSDSNILKIFRCLDREADHYYQPGIGTYVVSNSLSHTSLSARIRSWYLKAKDSAIGSSFDHHVVGGYRFLMRFYQPGDEIFFFGFSRGAYVARFLAEMLDYIGLLSHGNEEMVTFAWKAFSSWQSRQAGQTEEHQAKRREMYRFMKGFRETFSRPVKRIRFLGLFDTVNSVPRFETAWMQRSKMPYTARSSAKVIRHCVSIDERRAKFRQDLIYQGASKGQRHRHLHEIVHEKYRTKRSAVMGSNSDGKPERGRRETLAPPKEQAFRPHSRSRSRTTKDSVDLTSQAGDYHSRIVDYGEESDDDEQDIDEIWFAGGHADVGGGWEISLDSKSTSHVPLTYMIREAQRAGLTFDHEKLVEMGVTELSSDSDCNNNHVDGPLPDIRIDKPSPQIGMSQTGAEPTVWDHFNYTGDEEKNEVRPFHDMLHKAHLARIHDSLEFSSGLTIGQVLSWKIMEYMPFRRMDLQPDGSWKPIRYPLPRGEVRDIPNTGVHGSVIRRMKEDKTYRPGNLIIGGGGRGMRRAPDEYGTGDWECVQDHGDPVGEVWVRKTTGQNRA